MFINKQKTTNRMAMIAALIAVASPSFAKKDQDNSQKNKAESQPNPYLRADDTWISISGTAVDMKPDGFTLDYGEGTVLVEMDDWDWYNESNAILEGDKVTVYGEIDDDLYETTSIEAGSVYVENFGTYFYASTADEETWPHTHYWVDFDPVVVGDTTVRGTVSKVDGREFVVDTGARSLRVDTIEMPYNPMDDKGFQEVEKGDYVSVSGAMDYDFWDKRELIADSLVIISEDSSG